LDHIVTEPSDLLIFRAASFEDDAFSPDFIVERQDDRIADEERIASAKQVLLRPCDAVRLVQ
jgi:hypothetical protein